MTPIGPADPAPLSTTSATDERRTIKPRINTCGPMTARSSTMFDLEGGLSFVAPELLELLPASKPPIEVVIQATRAGMPTITLFQSHKNIECPNNESPKNRIHPSMYSPIHAASLESHSRRASWNVLPRSPTRNSMVRSGPT